MCHFNILQIYSFCLKYPISINVYPRCSCYWLQVLQILCSYEIRIICIYRAKGLEYLMFSTCVCVYAFGYVSKTQGIVTLTIFSFSPRIKKNTFMSLASIKTKTIVLAMNVLRIYVTWKGHNFRRDKSTLQAQTCNKTTLQDKKK